jgi:hypothetical protein
MAETAPRPFFRTLHQPSSHRIEMDVAQLFRLLGIAPHVEIVVTRLPERTSFGPPESLRHVLFQHLDRDRKLCSLRLRQQQMNMFKHDDISGDVKAVPFSYVFQGFLKGGSGVWRAQTRCTLIAAKRDEMQTTRLLVSFEAPWHIRIVVACAVTMGRSLPIFEFGSRNGKSKPPPCRAKRDKGGAPAGEKFCEAGLTIC